MNTKINALLSWSSLLNKLAPNYFTPRRIAVLLSGGVDSSVVLALLQELRSLGHSVTAFYLKIWLQDDLTGLGDCPWEEDLEYATKVCEQFKVPLKVISLQEEYWEQVVAHSINEIRMGHTPNPDMYCNSKIKFGVFGKYIGSEYSVIASGHYAGLHKHYNLKSKSSRSNASIEVLPQLKIGRDRLKDQSYFLAYLSKRQLARSLFPLGGLEALGFLGWEKLLAEFTSNAAQVPLGLHEFRKELKKQIQAQFIFPDEISFDTVWNEGFVKAEVRALARHYNLSNQNRKDSQGVCFLGKINFFDFIGYHMGKQVGKIVEWESNTVLGEHEGYWYYTIGQRQGLGLSGGPWYVVKKNCEKNIIYISKRDPNNFDERKFHTLQVSDINWFAKKIKHNFHCQIKVRHGERLIPARVESVGKGNYSRVKVFLEEPDFGTATGQFAVFYEEGVCIGAGIIHIE